MIRILVDSAADVYKEELEAKNIAMVPLTITVDGEQNYRDELELSRKELYRLLIEEKRLIKTSQPSPQEYAEIFEEVKNAGDEVICIALSSALSGTYQSALLAKNIVDYDKIYVIDSLTATYAIKIMADKALDMIGKGATAEEIVAELEVLKGRTRIIAAVDTLKYLYLGGRVSKTTAIVADAVNVKPGIVVTPDGKVGVGSKYLGVGRAIKDITKQLKGAAIDKNYPFYLVYSYNDENAQKLSKAVTEAGIEVTEIFELGATLGVHVGPGAFGVIYVAEK